MKARRARHMVPVGLAIGGQLHHGIMAMERGKGLTIVGEVDADEARPLDAAGHGAIEIGDLVALGLSAAMTTGPSPRSQEPVPPVTATFMRGPSDVVAVADEMLRPVGERVEIGVERGSIEVARPQHRQRRR